MNSSIYNTKREDGVARGGTTPFYLSQIALEAFLWVFEGGKIGGKGA